MHSSTHRPVGPQKADVPTAQRSQVAVHPLHTLQRAAGNAAMSRTHEGRPTLQRTVTAVEGRTVGNQEGAGNAVKDVQRVMHTLHQIGWANDAFDAQWKLLPKSGKAPFNELDGLAAGIEGNKVGWIFPAMALHRLGIVISANVGRGMTNAAADVELVCEVLRFEGIVTSAEDNAAVAEAGLAELKHRMLLGSRGLGPRIPGPPENALASLRANRTIDQGTLLTWPTLLGKGGNATPEIREQICLQIKRNRDNIPERMTETFAQKQSAADHRAALSARRPKTDPYHHGMSFTRAQNIMKALEPNPMAALGDEPAAPSAPLNPVGPEVGTINIGPDPNGSELTDAGPQPISRARANRLAWQEIRTEGSAGSINTYDSQWLTVGRGFGVASGQGQSVLVDLFARDRAFREAMLHVGFTIEGGTVMAVDPATETVLSGTDALIHLTLNQGVLSQYAATAESPVHMQHAADAQWSVLATHAAAIPDVVLQGDRASGAQPWDPEVMQFAVHANHFATGLCSWSAILRQTTNGRGDIRLLAKLALRGAQPNVNLAGMVWEGEQRRILEWGDRAFGRLVDAAPLEKTTADDGRYYFSYPGGYRAIKL